MGVSHASVYMLEVDDDSRLGRELMAGGSRYHAHFVPNDDATADFYQQACEMLTSSGFEQYEISNFARASSESPGNQSHHNLKYWTRQPYLGFGVDAHSMLLTDLPEDGLYRAVRFATPDSLDAYMNRAPHTVTPVSAQAAIEESFFLGLRLNRGIDLAERRSWEGHDFSRAADARTTTALAAEAGCWESAIIQCLQDGLLEQQGTTVRLTAHGRLLSNEVFARFLAEENKVGTGHVNPR
jgi:oxygen-independent coproporphyrinogen-3 oxidase